ncbi:MAG: hypothetical protein WC269_05525 [Candidatus Gracilibacteria bacterium]|jgi:hypothetical protein
MEINNINWAELLVGTFLGSILVPLGIWLSQKIIQFIIDQFPARKLLGDFVNNDTPCKLFIRDFILESGSKIISIEPRVGQGYVPNVFELWPEVEGLATSYILNVLGNVGKTRNIHVVKMSQDRGEWNANIIVLGAQAQKSFDFYKYMKKVAYSIDSQYIYDQRHEIVDMENGYGYGLILKAENPAKSGSYGFLIGGFGTLGTLAAAYYFRTNFQKLGRDFGNKPFGVMVRCPITAGEEATQRLSERDVKFV